MENLARMKKIKLHMRRLTTLELMLLKTEEKKSLRRPKRLISLLAMIQVSFITTVVQKSSAAETYGEYEVKYDSS